MFPMLHVCSLAELVQHWVFQVNVASYNTAGLPVKMALYASNAAMSQTSSDRQNIAQTELPGPGAIVRQRSERVRRSDLAAPGTALSGNSVSWRALLRGFTEAALHGLCSIGTAVKGRSADQSRRFGQDKEVCTEEDSVLADGRTDHKHVNSCIAALSSSRQFGVMSLFGAHAALQYSACSIAMS